MLDEDVPSHGSPSHASPYYVGYAVMEPSQTNTIDEYATAFSHSMFGPSGRPPQTQGRPTPLPTPSRPLTDAGPTEGPTMPRPSAPVLEHEIFSENSEQPLGDVLQRFIDHTNAKFLQKDADLRRTFESHADSMRSMQQLLDKDIAEVRATANVNKDMLRNFGKRLSDLEVTLAHVGSLRQFACFFFLGDDFF